ncbi:beta-lactamase family protein [Nostocaceae cyanobacterium CENA357]|uniref:Beta-lactamase family protein n=1 Tax=Atlanticothrix silvestris CENA357 TaxID=1725252 RepID=A0A8J7L4H1_9CYAN|nr:serine hydrolase domain-containing protein [Atlanticothrix silvestris]MBH8554786.1 beta-lactamase family protein [Atlanticothrix silvestris CENA357]
MVIPFKLVALVLGVACGGMGFVGVIHATTPSQNIVQATKCDLAIPSKMEVERTTTNINTQRFLNKIATDLDGKFKGYAVILTGADGRRLGFRRAGWAVDPCESDSDGEAFDLDTETAIGSVTKLFTTVAVLKVTTDSNRIERTPMTAYLPFRWRRMAHPYYETVTTATLLQHKAGFKRDGDGEHISTRLSKGRELNTPIGTRTYSNTTIGIFHFLYARYAFLSPYHETEVKYQNSPIDTYNTEIQKRTSHYFNLGLYKRIFLPLEISATCDPRESRFPPDRNKYFPFHNVARSYSSRTDQSGRLLSNVTLNCAPGGLYMSTKDLAKFMSALDDPQFLDHRQRDRMINNGNADNLFGFWTRSGAEDGRSFVHNGYRGEGDDASIAWVIRFPSGDHAVFTANSPAGDADVDATLIAAYNDARL